MSPQNNSNGGKFIDPKDMHTRHLYFTLCMTSSIVHMTSSGISLVQYMMDAVVALANELKQRQDLKLEWKVTKLS